jgi:hypothetical protein
VLLQAILGPGPELVEGPAGLGHADHRHVEMPRLINACNGKIFL